MLFRKITEIYLFITISLTFIACQSVRSTQPLIQGYKTYQDAHVTVHYPPDEKDLADVIVKENTFPIHFGDEEKFNRETATWKEHDLAIVAGYLGLDEPLPIMSDAYIQFQNLSQKFLQTPFSSVDIFHFDDLKKEFRAGINIEGLKYDRLKDEVNASLTMHASLSGMDKEAELSGSLIAINRLYLVLPGDGCLSDRIKIFHDKYGFEKTSLFTGFSLFVVLHEVSEVGFMSSSLRGIDSRWLSDGFANTVALLALKTHDENKNLSINELAEKYDLWKIELETIMDVDLEAWIRADHEDDSLINNEYYLLATFVFWEMIKENGTGWISEFCKRLRMRGNPDANIKEAYAVFTEITGKDMRGYIPRAKLRVIETVKENDESSANDKMLADALIYELNEDYTAAVRLFDTLLSGDSEKLKTREKANLYFQKARVLAKAKNNEDTLACYDSGLKLAPDVAGAWLNKAYLLDSMGKSEEADICFKKVNELYPKCAEGLAEKGRIFFARNDYDIAMDYCEKALKINSNTATAWAIKGVILMNTNNLALGEECIDKAIELNPNDVSSLRNKAVIYYYKGDMKNALIYLDKALLINPVFGDALDAKAKFLYSMGRKEEALICVNKLMEINPRNYGVWNFKMQILEETGKREEMVIFFDELLTMEPQNLFTLIKKANTLEELGRIDDAIAGYDKAIEFHPKNADGWFYKGRLLLNVNKNEEAVVCLNQATSLNDREFFGWYLLGVALRKVDRNQEALDAFLKAKEINAGNEDNNKQIAELEEILRVAAD